MAGLARTLLDASRPATAMRRATVVSSDVSLWPAATVQVGGDTTDLAGPCRVLEHVWPVTAGEQVLVEELGGSWVVTGRLHESPTPLALSISLPSPRFTSTGWQTLRTIALPSDHWWELLITGSFHADHAGSTVIYGCGFGRTGVPAEPSAVSARITDSGTIPFASHELYKPSIHGTPTVATYRLTAVGSQDIIQARCTARRLPGPPTTI